MQKEQRWALYVDPRLKSDKTLIEAFIKAPLIGIIIPVGASAGQPELTCASLGKSITGHDQIIDFLNNLGR